MKVRILICLTCSLFSAGSAMIIRAMEGGIHTEPGGIEQRFLQVLSEDEQILRIDEEILLIERKNKELQKQFEGLQDKKERQNNLRKREENLEKFEDLLSKRKLLVKELREVFVESEFWEQKEASLLQLEPTVKQERLNKELFDAVSDWEVPVGYVVALLKQGAQANAKRPKTGVTPLMHARDGEVAAILIKAGAKVNEKDLQGFTPLLHAVYRNPDQKDLIEVLVNAGADVKITFMGLTASEVAKRTHHSDIAELIEREATGYETDIPEDEA